MARLCRLLGVALVASVASLRRLEGECVDDPKWFYSGKSVKNCAYVGAKIKDDGSLARCKESNTDGERSALEACPATCGTCGKAPTPQPTAEATAITVWNCDARQARLIEAACPRVPRRS